MGATMHAHIEVRRNGTWFHYSAPNMDRDYEIHALCGDTMCIKNGPYAQRRAGVAMTGLPADASVVTKIAYEEDKELNHLRCVTVLDTLAILDLQRALHELRRGEYDLKTGFRADDLEETVFHTYIASNAIVDCKGWDDVRIICWFEN